MAILSGRGAELGVLSFLGMCWEFTEDCEEFNEISPIRTNDPKWVHRDVWLDRPTNARAS